MDRKIEKLVLWSFLIRNNMEAFKNIVKCIYLPFK